MQNEQLDFLEIMGSTATKKKKKNKKRRKKKRDSTSDDNGQGKITEHELSTGHTNGSIQIDNVLKGKTKRNKIYLTHLFATFIMFIFITNRVALSSFCQFDEATESYIIYQSESKTITNTIESYSNTLSQAVCQTSHSVLDYMALIIEPYVDYNTILPRSNIQPALTGTSTSIGHVKIGSKIADTTKKTASSMSGIIQHKINKLKNAIRSLQKLCASILHSITSLFNRQNNKNDQKTLRKDDVSIQKKEELIKKDSSSGDNENDLSIYVSAPMELNLSSQQREILEKTKINLLQRLEKEQRKQRKSSDAKRKEQKKKNDDEDVFKKIYWGGKGENGRFASFPWWYPTSTKGKNDDDSVGSAILASYLRIMKWPKNLVTTYPFSHLCTSGCPTDFALAHTIEFREKYQPWSITPSAVEENSKGWVYVRGYSPTRYHPDNEVGGSALMWYRPGLHKMSNDRYEAYARVLVHGIDTCIADAMKRSNGKIGKCNIVLDAAGFGLSYIPPIGSTKRILSMLQDHFPDKMGVLVVANMAKPAQIFMKMVFPFLPLEVRRKIHILPTDAESRSEMLKMLVEEKFIPSWLGGKDAYEFNANEYYKTGKYKSDFISDEEGIEYVTTMPYHA